MRAFATDSGNKRRLSNVFSGKVMRKTVPYAPTERAIT
jgi:hypothetical protein